MKQFLNLHVSERQLNRNIPHQEANVIVSFRQVFFFFSSGSGTPAALLVRRAPYQILTAETNGKV
jgi:hypothetical protein